MKTKEIINILIGIVVGTALGLFLTLYLWGDAWWQIASAIFVGGNIGCIITDAKLYWAMMSKSYEAAQAMLESVGNLKIKKRSRKKINKRKLIYAIHNWILFFLFLFLFFFSINKTVYFVSGGYLAVYLAITMAVTLLTTLFMVLANLLFFRKTVVKMVNHNFDEKIADFSSLTGDHKGYAESIYKLNCLENRQISLAKFFKRLWIAKFWDAMYALSAILMLTVNLVISIIGTLLFLVIIPFVLLKNLLSENKFLFVFLGVAIGMMSGLTSHKLLIDHALMYHIILGMLVTVTAILPAVILHRINEKLNLKNSFPLRIMNFFWKKMMPFEFSKI